MSSPWIGRIRRWLRPSSGLLSFDPGAFEKMCLEDPQAAHDALIADQRELRMDVERTYEAYRAKMDDLASRLETLSPQELQREMRVIRDAQDDIRRTLRRVEISARTAKELELELEEWESRAGEETPRHADHPDVRAEVVRSELASRGHATELCAIALEDSPFGRHALNTQNVEEESKIEEPELLDGREDGSVLDRSEEGLSPPDPDALVEAIRLAMRDADRWHGVQDHDEDALEAVHHLRRLHADLKRIDRERGIRRNRFALTVRTRAHD